MSLPANTNPYPCQFDRPKGNFSVGIVGLKKTEGLFKIGFDAGRSVCEQNRDSNLQRYASVLWKDPDPDIPILKQAQASLGRPPIQIVPVRAAGLSYVRLGDGRGRPSLH